MIEAIVGPPGAGKTAFGVLRMASVAGHRSCYSNLYPREHEYWRWLDWPGMREAGEGLYVIDEAHAWFNSRTFKENTGELMSWAQSRKRGADLVWIAQHENRVDTAIRELTTLIWRPKIVGPFLYAKGEDPDTGQKLSMRWFWLRKAFNLYFTDQVIGGREDPPMLAKVTGPKVPPTLLYCERPTHVIIDSEGFSSFREYRDADKDREDCLLLYRDYTGDFWMIDRMSMTVSKQLYETYRGHLAGFRRMVKLAAKERELDRSQRREGAASEAAAPTARPPFSNTGVTVTSAEGRKYL